VNIGGDIRFGRWRQSIVEVLVGASAVAIAFAAIEATAVPILGALALVGIVLLLERDVPARSTGNTEPQATRFDAALVDATSV
jgi:hypothetical protein